jgi:hypothetical protein
LNAFLPRRSRSRLNGSGHVQPVIDASVTREPLAQQMRVGCMARPDRLVEAAYVLYLKRESAPPAAGDCAGRRGNWWNPRLRPAGLQAIC